MSLFLTDCSILFYSLGTYEQLRATGFLKLPHRSTLQQYTSFTSIGASFNPDVIKKYYNELKLADLPIHERICSIMFDEMKIKSGLVFSRSTGTIIGFTELGQISDEIDSLERSLQKDRKKVRPLATHVLAIMIRGFFNHLFVGKGLERHDQNFLGHQYIYAYNKTKSTTDF